MRKPHAKKAARNWLFGPVTEQRPRKEWHPTVGCLGQRVLVIGSKNSG
jgi:hypothetical protein